MLPSEYLAEWYQSAADGYKDGVPDDEVVVFNKILALLEAIEELPLEDFREEIDIADIDDAPSLGILRAALALKETE